MSITLEPDKGLRLRFGRFSPIRSWHGGGSFWSHEFQMTIRSGPLAEFLPRAIEDEESVLFEYRSGGGEQASTSSAISSVSEIPAKQLNALRGAVEELKKKADDPHCDRTRRQMIESFRLPDPEKDRDLYRLVGKGSNAKLIVLWGIEREEGSALAPGAAVDLMHTPGERGSEDEDETSAPTASKKGLPVALVALLLLAAVAVGGGWYYWKTEQGKIRIAEDAAQAEEAQRIAAFNAAAQADAGASTAPATPDTPDTPDAPTVPIDEGTPVTDNTGTVTGVVSDDGEIIPADGGVKVDDQGVVSSEAEPGDIVKNAKGHIEGVVGKDGEIIPATPEKTVEAKPGEETKTGAPPGTVVRDGKGEVKGIVDKDGNLATAKPGTQSDGKGSISTAKPGSVFRDKKGTVTGVASKDGKIASTKQGSVARQTLLNRSSKGVVSTPDPSKKPGDPGKSTPSSNPVAKSGDAENSGATKTTKTTPGSVVRDSSGTVTGIIDHAGKVATLANGTTLDRNGRVNVTRSGTVIRDGKGRVSGVVGPDGKVVATRPGQVVEAKTGTTVTAPPGTVVRNSTGTFSGVVDRDGKVVAARPGTVIDKTGRVVSGTPGSVYSDVDGKVTGVAGTDSKVVDVPPNAFDRTTESTGTVASTNPEPVAPAPDSVTTPMTTQGPPPVGISALSVVSTSLSGLLPDGRVEVLLNVVARDLNGKVVNAPPINEWKVNGEPITGADGKPATGPVLPVSLSPGIHRISTVGTGADGKPYQTDADVTVTPKP